jgi:2-polyprenyl-6-hydroxyphenyl methylase / 3-demethylubiquinone-9 3-methyltransferase
MSLDPPPSHSPSVDGAEVAKFTALADEWWDPKGKFRPLHLFNPVRLGFIRDTAAAHFGCDVKGLRPFQGKTLLDVGCGGGLLSEPMARQGFEVLGIDASDKNIAIASAHAEGLDLPLSYRATSAEALAREGATFDLVLNMEVVEHVADLPSFLEACGSLLAPGGLMIVATLNRTLKSLALAKIGAEYVLRWLPPGTHDWNRFIRPEELTRHLETAGLHVRQLQGVKFDPLRWEWQLAPDTDVNYMAVAVPNES